MRDLILQLSKSSIYSTKPIIAKDQIVIVDPDTGKALPKVPKTDDKGKIILINGKPVMVDDPDGYNPVILKRLPEVTIAN